MCDHSGRQSRSASATTGRVNSRMVERRMLRLPGSPMLAIDRRVARTSVWFLGHSRLPTRSSALREVPTSKLFIDFHPIARSTGLKERRSGYRGDMLGHLYERALDGERCWIRLPDGGLRILPVHRWLDACGADEEVR